MKITNEEAMMIVRAREAARRQAAAPARPAPKSKPAVSTPSRRASEALVDAIIEEAPVTVTPEGGVSFDEAEIAAPDTPAKLARYKRARAIFASCAEIIEKNNGHITAVAKMDLAAHRLANIIASAERKLTASTTARPRVATPEQRAETRRREAARAAQARR